MRIEFQYFEGCPNSQKTLENLKEVLDELGVNQENLSVVEVTDLTKAKELNFQGSPTILIDGIDIYTGSRPLTSSYTCRVYTLGAERTGILPKEFISRKLQV